MNRLYLVTVEFEGYVWASSQAEAENLANEVVDEWDDGAEVTSRKASRRDIPQRFLDKWPTRMGDDAPGNIAKCLELQEAAEEEEAQRERERRVWEAHPRLELEEVAA